MSQIFSQRLTNKLKKLVLSSKDLPESSTLEYKAAPHDIKLHRCEFFKDILSLLNSSELPDEDRFLIYGVNDHKREPCGYDQNKGNDDATYQQLFDKISPRPNIQFADIEAPQVLNDAKFIGRRFGFFLMPSSNFGQVYEMAERVIDDIPSEDSKNRQCKRKSISAGASFTRNGSRVRPLMQSDRTRILEFKKQPEIPALLVDANTFAFDERGTSVFALAAIFGSWDETLPGDIQAIESASKMKYKEWIVPLRKLMTSESSLLAVKESVWTIPNRVESIKRCAEHLTLTQLQELQPVIDSVLSTVDPKYDLPVNKRFAAAIYGKTNPCSTGMRQGVAEFLAIIGTAAVKFPHCDKRATDQFICEIMQHIICATDWKVLASAESELPLLAEASPDFYLTFAERAYENGSILGDFLKQGPTTFGVSNGYGFFTGIQYAAQESRTFAKAMSLLEKLYDTTPLAAQTIERILLPWRPGTRADIQTRIAMGRRLADKGCWKSLLKLLPGETRTAISVPVPRYLSDVSFDEPVKTSEYQEVSQGYVDAAIGAAEGNPDRIIDLLESINSIDMAGKLPRFAGLLNKAHDNLTDAGIFRVWNELEILIRRYRAFDKGNEHIDHAGYALLNDAARALKPDDPYLVALFLFTHATYSLTSNADFRAGEREVKDERENAVDKLHKADGVDALKRLASECTELRSLGASMSAITHSEDATLEIIYWLSKEEGLEEAFTGFVTGIYFNDMQSCLNIPKVHKWPAEKTATYYAQLPCEPSVWKAAEDALGAIQVSLYWQIAPLRFSVDAIADAEYAISMYTSQERYGVATTYAGMCILQGVEIDANIVDKALQGLSPADTENELSAYYLYTICSYLDARHPTEALAWREFELLPLLRNAGALRSDSSLHLFKLMSQSPEFFMTILSLLYSKDSNDSDREQVKAIKERAFEVLHTWHAIPGNTETGIANEELDSWLACVNELANEAGLADRANLAIGRCFLHAPADADGLFIDKVVANYLDQNEYALSGYSEEAVNSQGAIWVGEHGESLFEIARDFDAKATELEHAGFMQFAAVVRNLAREYEMDGKREQEENHA